MPSEKGYLLPENIDAPTFCFSIQVPNDRYFIAAVMGQLEMLTYWYMWQHDTAHTGKIAAARWYSIFNNAIDAMNRGMLVCPPAILPAGGTEGGDETLLRQNPDNPCELQTSVDGVRWCTWADLSLCFATLTGQPSAPQTQPAPGGGCQTYPGKLFANAQYLIPAIVNTGDTVEILSLKGSGTDGAVNWYCVDGSINFAGNCAGAGHLDGTDPLPTSNHMAVIVKIGSTYYNANGGAITVPGGVVNQQVTVQVNDATLTDNSGDYSFEAKVCNNGALTWSHTFNFALSQQGWAITPGDCGHWTAGIGWVSELNPPTCSYDVITIQRTLPAILGGGYNSFKAVIGATVVGVADLYAASGADTLALAIGDNTITFSRVIANGDTLKCDAAIIPSNGGTGQFVIRSITVTGTGTEPTW